MDNSLLIFQSELKAELGKILNWWLKYAIDEENDGFYGTIDNFNNIDKIAVKGLVLNSRILYTFSSAYQLNQQPAYLTTAHRAFNYLTKYFLDKVNGGFFWSVDYKGEMLDGKKQVYGQAFAIYALAEYYKIVKEEQVLSLAKETFLLLEKYSYDSTYQGYIEAHTVDWLNIDDFRLSDKDQNEKKSMNTHLHMVEAYSNLYLVWENKNLKTAIKNLLTNFKKHIIHPVDKHLILFFTANWEQRSTAISFGHDIEAAWLLLEAAEIIAEQDEVSTFKEIAIQLTNAASEGLNDEGALWHEYLPTTNHCSKEIHWWPQAEAMVGFFCAWQISQNIKLMQHSQNSWNFIKKHLRDNKHGEWFWGINEDGTIMPNEDKAGFWKCPYHNSRACIEIIKRISSLN